MDRKYQVPSLELCKKLRPADFINTLYMWCEDDRGAAVIIRDHTCPDAGIHRKGYPGQLVYPAPTIGELMREIMHQVGKNKIIELRLVNDGKPRWSVKCEVKDSLLDYLENTEHGPERPEDQLAQTYLMLCEAKRKRLAQARKGNQNG